jgi:PIN domain nuclease of toxin-antitoxin system
MTKYVLDASCLLALINEEADRDVVQKALPGSVMSAVNVSEVVTVLTRLGVPEDKIRPTIKNLVHTVVPFDEEQAYIAGHLYTETQAKGLSFGDRACLSLGKTKNMSVLTADRPWSQIDCGVDVRLIR